MKKESNNYKELLGRVILVATFFLIIGHRTFAQCVDSDPGSACHTNINFDPACYAVYGGASDITDLKQSGLINVNEVTIDGAADANITNMTISDIIIKNAACGTIDGPYDSSTFPAATAPTGYGITFENNESEVTIRVTDPLPGAGINYAALPPGSHINFIVEAFNGDTQVASRRYTFRIVAGSYILGDTHITTVDGVKYDFQAVGEFVALRADSVDTFEIQTRQIAVGTQNPGFDSYSGLSTCVSVNSAVAARVGKNRITYQPNIDGKPDSSGMQLRVDGKLTEIGDNGIDLESGGRIINSPAGGGAIQIDFPDGASLLVTPSWWSHYNQWYLNLTINNAAASKGISGIIASNQTIPGTTISNNPAKSWLPALPDGTSLGPRPESLHDRFVTLYQTFADAWRVTDETSLFDYAPGTSTETFTDKNWPAENARSCSLPGQTPQTPIELEVAQKLASGIIDPIMKANAIFDVMVTGEPSFANTYLLTQQSQMGTTITTLNANKDTTKYEEPVTFTAIVTRRFAPSKDRLNGTVEFTIDGKPFEQVNLEGNGRANLTTSNLEVGQHQVVATFMPDSGSKAFSSSSLETTHTVIGTTSILHQWWFWLLLILIIAGIFMAMLKKKHNP